jgi:hypothetical protein
MRTTITLDANESHTLIGCLVRAAEVGETTGNLELAATARYLADLIIDKWLSEGGKDA